jgi:hypothetical protein
MARRVEPTMIAAAQNGARFRTGYAEDDVAPWIARHRDLDRLGAPASGGLSATGVPSDTFIVRLFVHRGRRG